MKGGSTGSARGWVARVLPADLTRDASSARRASLVVASAWSMAAVGFALGALNTLLELDELVVAIFAVSLVNLFIPLTIWLTRSILVSANAVVATTFVGVSYTVFETGGPISPALPWAITVPILALFLAGRRASLAWTMLIAAALAALLTATALGVSFEMMIPEGQFPFQHVLSTTGILVSVAALLMHYDRSRREAEEALATANHELELARDKAIESSRQKGQFLANVSHEIRTPMSAVIGMSDLLLAGPLPQRQRMFVATIKSSARSLLRLLDDVLSFSRNEAGVLVLQPGELDLRDTLDRVLELMAEPAFRKGLELIPIIEVDVPGRVIGDSDRLRQVLLNLMANAVKFTDRGEVVLRVSQVSDTGAQTWTRFSVRDTGGGFQGDAEELFEPFSRESATASSKEGIGLGLAICRQLVELMGGRMGAFNRIDGRGAEFWFEIPLEARPDASSSVPSVEDEHILILDPLDARREGLEKLLASLGASFVSAADPSALSESERSQSYDAVLCPHELALLSARPELSQIPFIFLANLASTLDDVWEVMSANAQVVARPARRAELARVIAGIGSSPREDEVVTVGARRQSARILVVDDNPVNRDVITLQLQMLGHAVDSVADGQAALDRMRESQFNLVLMDCKMPGLDGFETTRRLRATQDRSQPPIKIVALTATALEEERDRCFDAGMDDFITKPIELATLEAMLERHLPSEGEPSPPVAEARHPRI